MTTYSECEHEFTFTQKLCYSAEFVKHYRNTFVTIYATRTAVNTNVLLATVLLKTISAAFCFNFRQMFPRRRIVIQYCVPWILMWSIALQGLLAARLP